MFLDPAVYNNCSFELQKQRDELFYSTLANSRFRVSHWWNFVVPQQRWTRTDTVLKVILLNLMRPLKL